MNITIPALDADAMQQAREKQSTLLKPQGALGELETLSIQLAGMTRRIDWMPEKRVALLFGADHGVMVHNTSTVPQAITAFMMSKFLQGEAAINVLARQMGARLTVVDVGVNGDLPLSSTEHARFVSAKIANGTADFSTVQAMTDEQARQALQLGADTVADEIKNGMDILTLGEMGIGNTTSASAIIASITGSLPEAVTGRGTGIDDETYQRKIGLINQALELHNPTNVNTLAKVGGFEIGAMAGAMLYAASQRIPVVIDGVICTAAALIAQQINPEVTQYLISGHNGAEPGHQFALKYLELLPLLTLDLRLGEGTGALLVLPLIETAMRTLNEMGILDVR